MKITPGSRQINGLKIAEIRSPERAIGHIGDALD
jgi:hypothetical protein